MPILISDRDRFPALCGRDSELISRDTVPGPFPSLAAPTLKVQEVHLWALPSGTKEIVDYTSLLSSMEMDRARRFRFSDLSERFVLDHGRLRLLLGAYLEIDPRSLVFAENKQGKPRVSLSDCRLRFNMSHTRGLTMIAVCLDAELGVDVEELRVIEDRDAIAASHFSPLESHTLQAQPEEERDKAFLRCWTRKEAYIKARGEGLSLPLDQFAVTLSSGDRPALLHCAWDEREPQRWRIEHLQPTAAHVGALTIEQGNWSFLHFIWPAGNQRQQAFGDRL
jgi:4'-phosphopantetheinyl transferase